MRAMPGVTLLANSTPPATALPSRLSTTSDFSAGAIKEAAQPDKTPIALMNGEQLVMLLMEHGIGVHRSTPDLFEIDEEFAVITLNAVKE